MDWSQFLKKLSKEVEFLQQKNLIFLIFISLQSDVVNLWYLKLWILSGWNINQQVSKINLKFVSKIHIT